MDKNVVSVKELKRSLRKTNIPRTTLPINTNNLSNKESSKSILDRFLPSRIDFNYSAIDTKVLNVFSNNKDLKKHQKSSYLKMIESELLENSTPSNLFTHF